MYSLFIVFKITSFPAYIGIWMDLQIFGYLAITSITSRGKSFGWGEVKRNLISENSLAKFSNNYANLIPFLSLVLKFSLKPSVFLWGI